MRKYHERSEESANPDRRLGLGIRSDKATHGRYLFHVQSQETSDAACSYMLFIYYVKQQRANEPEYKISATQDVTVQYYTAQQS